MGVSLLNDLFSPNTRARSTLGGEDLFEFLDERVPATLVIPPAPIVTAAPVVAPAPIVESREPSGYTAPVFFPFGKPEPTAPQLKLSGVSSFKKINRSDDTMTVWFVTGKKRVLRFLRPVFVATLHE